MWYSSGFIDLEMGQKQTKATGEGIDFANMCINLAQSNRLVEDIKLVSMEVLIKVHGDIYTSLVSGN